MQDTLPLFLALLVAHVLGDFVFQTAAMVDGKKAGRPTAFLRHGAVHLAAAMSVVLIFVPRALSTGRFYALLGLLAALHLAADHLKERTLAAWLAERPRRGFVLDQCLHLASIFGVVALFAGGVPSWAKQLHALLLDNDEQVLWVSAVYLTTIFAGGYLIRVALPDPPASGEEASLEDEKRIGMYIGWLERFLVLTAVIAKSPTAVGLIVTAKSIVRFKRVERGDAFAEYFLLGTFLSLALALIGGLLLRWLLVGGLDLE